MNDTQKNKIKNFLADETMSSTVYDVLWRFFLKRREIKDTQMLATERMAALLFEDAWKELQRYRIDEKEAKGDGNVGL